MDWTIATAWISVGALGGYLIGLLVRGDVVDRRDGGGGESGPDLPPPEPSLDDFDLWELEAVTEENAPARSPR